MEAQSKLIWYKMPSDIHNTWLNAQRGLGPLGMFKWDNVQSVALVHISTKVTINSCQAANATKLIMSYGKCLRLAHEFFHKEKPYEFFVTLGTIRMPLLRCLPRMVRPYRVDDPCDIPIRCWHDT